MSGTLEKVEKIQRAAELHLKGWTDNAIGRDLGISSQTVRAYIEEWEDWIEQKIVKNPDILEQYLENTLKFDEAFAMLEKEAWSVVEEAKEAGVAAARIQALKLAESVTEKRAKLHQLLGPRANNAYMEDLKKAQRVNEILSGILRDEIADCPRCKARVWDRLQDVFMGGKEPEPVYEVEVVPALLPGGGDD